MIKRYERMRDFFITCFIPIEGGHIEVYGIDHRKGRVRVRWLSSTHTRPEASSSDLRYDEDGEPYFIANRGIGEKIYFKNCILI